MSKACKKCKHFSTAKQCPLCGGSAFSTNWKGKIVVLNPEQSEIAQKLGIEKKGDYAIKVS